MKEVLVEQRDFHSGLRRKEKRSEEKGREALILLDFS